MASDASPLELLPDDWERGLAMVAHPDDLEFGVSTAVSRWTSEGRQVAYVLATSGEAGIDAMSPAEAGPLREAEQRASAAVVGVDSVEFLGHNDGVLENGLPLRRDLARAIRRHRPEILVSINFHLSWGGRSHNMADHRVFGLAVLDAARDAGNRWVFPELADEGLEPWPGTTMACFGGSPRATHAVDVTGHLDAGVRSLEAHATYLANLDEPVDPRAFLERAAVDAGARAGVDMAVALEVFDL